MGSNSYFNLLKKSRFDFKKTSKYKDYYDKILEKGLFDKTFYLNSYPHVKSSGMDPLIHYLFYGYKEGKLPSASFNLEKYLEKYPDLKENPLVHYIENNENGFKDHKNPCEFKKDKIISTNSLFLNNFTFEEEPLVSIIILNRNGLNHMKCLFKDFKQNTNYSNYEIIVVDNASCDESVEYLYSLKKELPIKIIENNKNLSFSKANNEAVKIAKGEYLVLLNNDMEPTFGWLNEMMGTMLIEDKIGAVGAKLIFPYYPDMENQSKSFSIQHAGVKFREEISPYVYGPYHENMFSTLIFNKEVNQKKEVIANTAAAILIPKDLYLNLRGLDERFVYGYEDVDFAFKLYQEGYKSIYCPQALLFHHESATRQKNDKVNQLNFENIMELVDKWGNFLFKSLLLDKLDNKHFFTDKKLQFSIVNIDSNNDRIVYKLTKDLNKKSYNVNLISNINDLNLGDNCDILISFSNDYDVKNTISRPNLIKMFVSDSKNNEYDLQIDIEDVSADKIIKEIRKKYLED